MFESNLAGTGAGPKSCSYLNQPACLIAWELQYRYCKKQFTIARISVENISMFSIFQQCTVQEHFLQSNNVKCFGRNKYWFIQQYFCVCDHSRHKKMYSTHKKNKGLILISLNRQCILLSGVIQEEKPWVFLFLSGP